MKIGILQTGHSVSQTRAALGDFDDMFMDLLSGHDFRFETFYVVDMEFPHGPEQCGGWLVTGSRHGAYEDHPFIAPLEQLIRDIYSAKRPMIGICFGHQIIAQALGGRVEKYEGGWTVGRQSYEYQGRQIALNAWHQDQVTRLPEDATIIASNPSCAYAGLLYGDTIYTLQAHPEFGAEAISSLITHRAEGIVPGPLIDRARSALDHPTDRQNIAADMAAFFKGNWRNE